MKVLQLLMFFWAYSNYRTRPSVQCLTVLLLFNIPLVQSIKVNAQISPKAPVTEKDYHLWGNLYFDKISEYGNWASFRMAYDENPDTLFVRNAHSAVTFKIPLNKSGSFNKETHFASITPGQGLELINLKKGTRKLIGGVTTFNFISNGNFLVTQRKSANLKCFDIRSSDGICIDSITGIQRFVLNSDGNMALCSFSEGENSKLVLITFGKTIDKKVIIESKKGIFSYMVWQENSQSFAFLQHTSDKNNGENNSVYYYRLRDKKLYFFDPDYSIDISKRDRISDTYQSKLTISDDGTKIFFGLEKKIPTTQYATDKVQIWNGNDNELFPYRKEYLNYEVLSKLTLWQPANNRIVKIGTDKHPYVVLSGDQQFAITFNPSELGLQYKEYYTSNFYLTNLATGVTKLWVEDQSTATSHLNISPTGKYAAYFKDDNWWIYNFANKTHTNLTDNKIKDLSQAEKIQKNPFGFEGWTGDDKDIIIRDKYDIWKISIERKKYNRITLGREKNIVYSVKTIGTDLNGKRKFDGVTGNTLDLDCLLLEAVTSTDNSYYLLNNEQNLKPIVREDGLLSFLNKASKNDSYIYVTQDYNRPPSLRIKNTKIEIEKVLIQSNPQHFNYLWGKSELVEYVNSKNQKLNSILYYPADYQSDKKYPMVVYMYEKFPNELHRYYNPSLLLDIGINPANLNAKGYFVLIPDIEHEIGDPGISATDCIISATKEIIHRGYVDSNKIGLTGHSFGGYETNFIITQSDLFAAAVSGAGIGDFTGHYFSIGWNWGKAEMWRYEDQQNRMKKSFFEDKAGYDRNSPVQYADKVKTPILIWTGEEDKQINYTQSIAFYLALKRNNKKQIMLVYPGDAHVITTKSHQIDLTHRIEQWFDYYLKGIPADWISNGTH